MSSFLHQRPIQNPFSNAYPISPRSSSTSQRPISIFSPTGLTILLSLMVILGVFAPWSGMPHSMFSNSKTASSSISKWQDYSLAEAASFVAKNGTLIVCAVSQPYLPFLNNWLISITRQKHQEKVLVIAEDYVTLDKVNEKWPGHAVLIPPALDSQTAHKFGSQGFFNFTARRPRHLLQILKLGYNVMYNDVDMVWLGDPFPYFEGNHDVYFTDDMTAVKPLNHSHDLPPPGKKGRPYICSCMIFLRATDGAKLVMKKWIEELQAQPWSKAQKANDQPAFNWALLKTAGVVDLYLLPQSAFPTGGLYFKNKTWVQQTKGMHVIIHNNYILGFEKKIKRFRDYGLWLVDDHVLESPLGRL
ncbi:UDP-D-xylose:L-fucose alpha-1,3-D-xylosyltransferase MGP4 [Hibiscus syriacus]|uniref:Glycosyltransferase n=1 Tax=Hibiscus syriacus TaxID=106335 RepID=A0A6A3AYJ2_HIBSY|nr:UDP-D-xylose:L-fucose alpha-1,3-D-xylosyltransferase MGP4-like [Hibiscus syriacus]KAE8708022.1 UDP-D-xylose:L-fucose alpha-1,3-D-xylosyltransferase MGP4 [Hibiscus syriacus]